MSNRAIDRMIEQIANSKSVKAVNYTGFGLRLSDCLELAREIRDGAYSPTDGERETDIKHLADKLSALYENYLQNKREWGGG